MGESHDGSNLAPLTKEESVETSDMYLLFLFDMCPFYKHSINNAQTSNKYVGRKSMGLNCGQKRYGSKLSRAVMG